ncbi:MAG: magnesium transporter [Phycisphaeraceae bacterium]
MVANHHAIEDALAQRFFTLYPDEAARHLDGAPAADAAELLSAQSDRCAATVISRMDPELASQCIEDMDHDFTGRILPMVEVTHLAALMARLTPEVRERQLSSLDPGLSEEVRQLMSYPDGTAGHLMDPKVYSFRPDITVEEVLERLHSLRQRRILDLFLVNEQGQLVGAVPLPEVVMAESDQPLAELVKGPAPSIQALAPQDEVVEALDQSRLTNLPVVDINGKLIGVIRQTTLVQTVAEEASAGLQTMVGVSKEERALSSPIFAVRKRLVWLNINLLTAFLAAAVVGLFENTIAEVTALAVLLPVVAGQSGNTGAQALAVTMRGLALREIRVRHWAQVMLKELTAGTINGIAIAIVTMIGVYVWSQSLSLCAVIGLAMVISMAIAAIAGTAVPIVLTILRQDPAQSSSIILTTVTDVVGFFSFLGLATLFINALVSTG